MKARPSGKCIACCPACASSTSGGRSRGWSQGFGGFDSGPNHAKSTTLFFLGGEIQENHLFHYGLIGVNSCLIKRWEGKTSTWRMIFFLSVLFGSQMLHGPWVRPMLRWLMGFGGVQLFELFGTKRSEQIKQNSLQGRALNQPCGLVAWTCLDTCF